MILDAQALFSDAQAITASAVSTNSIDLGLASGYDLGSGENLFIHLNVDVAFTDSGSDSTVAVTLVTDDNASLSSPTAVQTLGTFAALSAVGATIKARIQPGLSLERYVGLNYTVSGGNLTTGSITAALVKDVDTSKAYADAITIS
jgi:hypothetical protein